MSGELQTIYTVQHWREIDPDWLVRETDRATAPEGKTHAVVRFNEVTGKARLWGWYASRSTALAAARRWRLRDIHTR